VRRAGCCTPHTALAELPARSPTPVVSMAMAGWSTPICENTGELLESIFKDSLQHNQAERAFQPSVLPAGKNDDFRCHPGPGVCLHAVLARPGQARSGQEAPYAAHTIPGHTTTGPLPKLQCHKSTPLCTGSRPAPSHKYMAWHRSVAPHLDGRCVRRPLLAHDLLELMRRRG
jgi:hypothetical protein